MKKDDFLKLLNDNAVVVAELLGLTVPAVYAWRRNGVPFYWWGVIQNLSDTEVAAAFEVVAKRKIESVRKRAQKRSRK